MTKPLNGQPVLVSMTYEEAVIVTTALGVYGTRLSELGADRAAKVADDLADRIDEVSTVASENWARNNGVAVAGDEFEWDGSGF